MKIILTLTFAVLLNSCIVLESMLGLDRCNYTDCDRKCINNCDYCAIHCDKFNVPEDFDSRIGKSIDKQIDLYKEQEKKRN